MGTKKLSDKNRIRQFNFEKKPVSPCFLLSVAKGIISFPDLKKRKAVLTKTNMEGIEDKPYLMLVTHSSMVDFNLMLKATHPHKVNNVMTLEGFHTYTEPLMRSLGVLGTRKFITDIHLIRNMKYCVEELKNPFVLFPEARYSLDGCTSYLPQSLGKMVKLLGVPVVVLRIHGNFVTCPQWNKINKKTFVEAEMKQIITAEETKSLSAKEINDCIVEHFQYDDFAWQKEKQVKIDHPQRAKGLHALLYKCPSCREEHQTDSEGTRLWCNCCKKTWEMDEYGQLHALEGETEFPHIPDWSNWERACVREEIENGTYYFEDEVRVETLPGSWKFYKQGMGKLIQTPEETRVECNYYGEPYVLKRSAKSLESMHIEYDYLGRGDCVDISIPKDSFWCYLTKRDAITKISFATEEMHKLAMKRA
ncbi:MAG: hypothetical protein J6A77_02275 [Lachnospiraceae bacterium]|nr:hypothetical protein [Lachnospiraceae bacterium]